MLPPPDSDPAVLVMNEEQRGILYMIEHEGRVLPESITSEEKLKEQDLILYLAAVDASITLGDVPGGRNPILCPGTRRWVLSKGLSECDSFDIYHDLFHIHDETICPDEYDKYWYAVNNREEGRFAYTIQFSPNRYCDTQGRARNL